MKCENCNKEHDGSYGSGRFCSAKCSRSFSSKKQDKSKIKQAMAEASLKYFNKPHFCIICGAEYHTKDYSRKECFDCRPETIKRIKTEKMLPDSILDISKRTAMKIVHRMKLPCSCCGIYIDGIHWDFHHIIPKKEGGQDDMMNITYICPNCHRIAHSNKDLLQRPLVSIKQQLQELHLDWHNFYYVQK